MTDEPAPVRVAGVAAREGGIAALVVIASATVVAWVVGISQGLELGTTGLLRLASFYLATFHRATVEFQVEPLPATTAEVAVTGSFLLGSILAVGVLWRAGRRSAAAAEAGPRPRTAPALLAAACYVIVCGSVIVWGGSGQLVTGWTGIGIEALPALLWMVAVAVPSAVAGALWGSDMPPSTRWVLRGAGRVTAWALIGSFVAMLLVAAIDPSYSRVYFAGVRGARTTMGVSKALHNVLLLPNEASWAVTAATGGCLGVRGSIDADLVCTGRLASGVGSDDLASLPTDPEAVVPEGSAGPPLVLLFFVLALPVAGIAGGRLGARDAPGPRAALRRGVAVGALAGIGLGAVAWFSGFAVRVAATGLDVLQGFGVRVGPVPWSTVLITSAWAVLWAVVGAASRRLKAPG